MEKETKDTIQYQFTAVPTQLFLCMDLNCRSVLFTLIQLSSHYGGKDGWFFRTNADLEAEARLSKNVVIGALDSLYKKGLVDIIPQERGQGKKQLARMYRVNFDKFKEYEYITIEDCFKNPLFEITTSDYKSSRPSWMTKVQAYPQTSTQETLSTSLQSDNNIDNVDIEDNRDNTEYNILNNNILNNTVSVSSEVSDIETSVSESEISSMVLNGLKYIDAHKAEVVQERDEDDGFTNAAYEIMETYEGELKNWICSIKHNGWDSTSGLQRLATAIKEQPYESQADLEKTVMDVLTYQARSEAAYERELKRQIEQALRNES